MRVTKSRLAMQVLWPSFLVAVMAEGVFFSLFEPAQLTMGLPSTAVYTLGFFLFWTTCALASLFTAAMLTVPDGDPPF